MSKEVVHTKNAPAAPAYTSQANTYDGLVRCSGNVALKDDAFEIMPGGIRTETRAVIQNLSAILKQAGSSLGSVLKVNIFITSMDDLKAMNEVYEEFFSKHPIKPVGHFKSREFSEDLDDVLFVVPNMRGCGTIGVRGESRDGLRSAFGLQFKAVNVARAPVR